LKRTLIKVQVISDPKVKVMEIDPNRKRIVVISGLSGSGKSVAARALEDSGYFVVDNLPPDLLEKLTDLLDHGESKIRNLALVIDAREPTFLARLPATWKSLVKGERSADLLFLDSSDDTLIRRFKETRRVHPLERGKGIRDALAKERELLKPIMKLAGEVINTDDLNVHQLSAKIKERFTKNENKLMLTLMSFGFKYGVPKELDLCFDARFIDNPYFVDELRALSGLDEKVFTYVLKNPRAGSFVDRVAELLRFLYPYYQEEGKAYLTLAIGCTGGRHRAPALVGALSKCIQFVGSKVRIEHRDIDQVYK